MRNMKRLGLWMIVILLCLSCVSAGYAEQSAESATRLYIRIGDEVLAARLADNSSAQALTELLREGDVTLDMHDYGNFEKVGDLPASLPRNDESITTQAGDLILYQGSRFVLYYDVNTWDFTRLGWLEGVTQNQLVALLGAGDVTATLSLTNPLEPGAQGELPIVYMTSDISPEGLMAVYQALGRDAAGENVAVKISTGEPPASNYLRVELIGDFVKALGGTFVECNTAYGGPRASAAMHYQVAEDHGYTAVAKVDIMDEDASMTLPVIGGTVLTENYVGAHMANYDYLVVLSHFKGHGMAGFGGAIKNLSIGCASSEGKKWIHSGGTDINHPWDGEQDAFLEAMAEAAKSVVDFFGDGERCIYINVMNRLSVDCDCAGYPEEPDMHDVGILASLDPVALDQACVDLVYASEEGESLVYRIESLNGLHTLEHAADIGFGSREYTLVRVD